MMKSETNYCVIFSTMRRAALTNWLDKNQTPEMVVWLTGSCEWQVRVYK
jgi:hypothetical protein